MNIESLMKIASDRKKDLEGQLNAINKAIALTNGESSPDIQKVIANLEIEIAFIESTLK